MASVAQEDVFEAHQTKGWPWYSVIFFLLVVGNGSYEAFFDPRRTWGDGIFLFLITPLAFDQLAMAFGPPYLRLDSAGIRYRMLSRHVIPWDHVAAVGIDSVWGMERMSISLKEGMRLPPTRWFGLQRILHKFGARGDFRLFHDALDQDLDAIGEAVERIGGIKVTRAT